MGQKKKSNGKIQLTTLGKYGNFNYTLEFGHKKTNEKTYKLYKFFYHKSGNTL